MTNFGDEMSPLAWEYATGRHVAWSLPDVADVVGIGSVLELALGYGTHARVWGTGARGRLDAAQTEQLLQLQVLALRGPLTAGDMGRCPNAPALGDPGLLIREFVRTRRRRTGMLFLPHYRTWATAGGRARIAAARAQGFAIADPSRSPLEVGNAIAASTFVASSSLHGIVFAHALGVPVQGVHDEAEQPAFKYQDYYASLHLTPDLRPAHEVCTRRFAEAHVPRLEALAASLADRLSDATERLVLSTDG